MKSNKPSGVGSRLARRKVHTVTEVVMNHVLTREVTLLYHLQCSAAKAKAKLSLCLIN
jgi:hypothetical protein